MVKLSRILFLTFILRLQDCVECFQNVVVVNNKQMTYNRKGELVELDKMITNLKTEKNVEKSNIFKSTAFVTDSQFKGQIKDFKSGLKKNSISNRVPPSRGHILTKKQPTKSSTIHRSSTSFPIISTSTSPSQLTAVIFSDDLSSTENSLHNTYDDIKMDFHQYLTDVTEKPQSIESTIFVFSTPSPISPIIIKNTKKKKKKKLTTTPIPVHEHIIQNLDYYRKLLGLNCTAKEAEKQENGLAASEQVVTITPKPTVKLKVPVQSASLTEKFDYEDTNESSVEGKGDKKKKKHCKKKHGHHTHEHHHKDSHEHHNNGHHDHGHHGHGHGHKHGHHHKDSHSHEYYHKESYESHSKEHGIKHKKKVHQIHNHIHHVADIKKKNKWPPKHHKEEIIYYDIPLAAEFEKAGDIFDNFYGFFEEALTSKEIIPYNRDILSKSESESDYEWGGSDYFGGHHHHRKRSVDNPIKTLKIHSEKNILKEENSINSLKKRPINSINPRKSMKITVTSEYDDSIADHSSSATSPVAVISNGATKKPRKLRKTPKYSSEDSEEYSLVDEIMGLRDDLDDSGDIDENIDDSIEYYEDEMPSNRLPDGDNLEKTLEEYSDENTGESILDNFTNIFSSIGSFFSTFSDDKSRQPQSKFDYYDDDYDEESRATTLKADVKVEHQSKRPKRENVDLPWYKPSFLFSNDDKETVGSDAQVNWLKMPWQRSKDDENQTFTTTEDIPTIIHSYNIVEKVKQYLMPPAQKKIVSKKFKNMRHRKKYDNYQLWRLFMRQKEDRNFLKDFKVSSEGLKVHWLNELSSKGTTDVIVSPDFVEEFQQLLLDNEIKFYVKNRNIQHAIHLENPRFKKRDQIEMEVINGHTMTWHHYHSYSDLQSYFSFLRRKFSNNVELIQIGYSFEGRPLTIVKVTDYIESKMLPKELRNKSEKPAIFIQSGAESHEWLNLASASFILNKIVSKIKGNETDRIFIENFDWFFMPLTNPDGAEYSMKHDRLWQKTRSRHFPTSSLWSSPFSWFKTTKNDEDCVGVNANRNFEYGWMKNGASNDLCSDFYAGPHAFSEPETKLLSEFISNSNRNFRLIVSLSGYGRKISFDSNGMNQDQVDDIRDIARAGVNNIKTSKFTVDSKSKSCGSFVQFAIHQAKKKYSFKIEARDDDVNGVFVPASSIEENAEEMYDIIIGMVKKLKI